MFDSFDIVVIGAGISGLTIAREYAEKKKMKVLVLEKRPHIGGNCYDYYNKQSILVPEYGPHYFHTNNEYIWKYVSRFTDWHEYEHRVYAFVDGKYVPVPVNITTVNLLLGENLSNEWEMLEWLNANAGKFSKPKNGEEACISRVGQFLYEKIFKNYTKKHWDLYPHQLDASVLNRIPVRTDYDDRYFSDKYQGMPKYGYTKLFLNMASHENIKVVFNVDFFEVKNILKYKKLFFTGPIDKFFGFVTGKRLQYRSLIFQHETLQKYRFQPVAQVNYPNDNKFTRIIEPKHATGQVHEFTTIIREYGTSYGEEFYPVPNARNRKIYSEYQKISKDPKFNNIYFVGRLATYKYINMDQAFKYALDLFFDLEYGL